MTGVLLLLIPYINLPVISSRCTDHPLFSKRRRMSNFIGYLLVCFINISRLSLTDTGTLNRHQIDQMDPYIVRHHFFRHPDPTLWT